MLAVSTFGYLAVALSGVVLGAILADAVCRAGARSDRELLRLMREETRAHHQETAAAAAARPRSGDVRVEPHD